MQDLVHEFLLGDCPGKTYAFVDYCERHRAHRVAAAKGREFLDFDNIGADEGALQSQSVGHPGHVGAIHSSRRNEYLDVHRLVDLAQPLAGFHGQGTDSPGDGLDVLNNRGQFVP